MAFGPRSHLLLPSPRCLRKESQQVPKEISFLHFDSTRNQALSALSDQPSSFQIDRSQLTRLVKGKDHIRLREFGGINKVASALETDVSGGISGEPDEVTHRQNAFGFNTYNPPAEGFFHFVFEAFKELTLMILLVCAGLSSRYAIKENGVKEGWYDSGSPFFAVFPVIVVSAVSNYRQNRQFDKLCRVSYNILIDVIRKGRQQQISIFVIVVVDVVCLKMGDQVLAESIFGVDEAVKRTLIFNAFVLCQVFNEFNARKLEKKNVFEGIHKNKLFLGIILVMVVLQVVMVEFLKRFAVTEWLSWGQWGACVGIAAASWPIGWVIKCIRVPDAPIFSYLGLKSKKLVRKIVHREQFIGFRNANWV